MSPEQARGETARRPHRSVRGGHHPVGAAHRAAAVSVEQGAGRAQGRPHVRGAPAARAQSRVVPPSRARVARAARAGSHRAEGAGARAGGPLRDAARSCAPIWRRSWRRRRPTTDATRLANFLHELFADDIAAERAEREALIVKAREWYSAKHAAAPPPPRRTRGRRRPRPLGRAAAAAVAEAGRPARRRRPRRRPIAAPIADRTTRASGSSPCASRASASAIRARRTARRHDADDDPTASLTSRSDGGRSTAVLGTVVGGRYHVRRLCGEGGMGRVYEAEHIDIGKRVALKVLHPALQPDARPRRAVPARGARRLEDRAPQHRRRHRLGHDARRRVLLRDGVPRGDRARRAHRPREARSTSGARCIIGTQICRALQAAHAVNVIHRDLKPENMLILTRDGQTRLRQGARLRHREDGNDSDLKESQGGAAAADPPRAWRWARPSTWRPSRRRASRPIRAPTSTRSAACSTRC